MTNHVMLDIETLSTHPNNSVVLSIGAVRFRPDQDDPLAGFSDNNTLLLVPDIRTQILNREISDGTKKFWREQPLDARSHWLCGDPIGVTEALVHLDKFIGGNTFVWSHGACFDIGNLESLYREYHVAIPWRYNAVRDSRTVVCEFPECRAIPLAAMEMLESCVPHHPISDCKKQIWDLWARWPASIKWNPGVAVPKRPTEADYGIETHGPTGE